MKYVNSITINKPFKIVWEFFDNPDKLKTWQPTLQSFEHMHGEMGMAGVQSKLVYKEGKKTIEMIETIIERKEGYLKSSYEVKGVYNLNEMIIKPLDEKTTEVTINSEFEFKGLMKYLTSFAKSIFERKTQTDLERLKKAIENGE